MPFSNSRNHLNNIREKIPHTPNKCIHSEFSNCIERHYQFSNKNMFKRVEKHICNDFFNFSLKRKKKAEMNCNML